jgi:hypothetical protein
MGTRRSICSSAPMHELGLGTALAWLGRTTSTPARAQASRSMFSAPADSRPTMRSTRRVTQRAAASSATDGGIISARTLARLAEGAAGRCASSGA